MVNKFKQLVVQEEGQGMTEYGLVLGVIAIGVIAAITLVGGQVEDIWKGITTKLGGVDGVRTE